MKGKFTKKFAIIVAVLTMAFCFAACGGGGTDGPYSGTWTSTNMTVYGMELSVSENLGSDIIIEIYDDGKGKFKFDSATDSFKWTEKESGIISLDHPDMAMEMVIEGDSAVLDFMGYDINMER